VAGGCEHFKLELKNEGIQTDEHDDLVQGCLAEDSPDELLLQTHFSTFKAFVDSAFSPVCIKSDVGGGGGDDGGSDGPQKQSVVMVHCAAGINRSGLLGLAYAVEHTRAPLMTVLGHALASRGPLLWNAGFQRQLVEFARELGVPLK
jgi:hypothetical protein